MTDQSISEKYQWSNMPLVERSARGSEPVQILESDNQRLRDLVVSLGAALLRNIASDSTKNRRAPGCNDVEYLLGEAEKSFRCARYPGLKAEIAEGLEATGHEFMAKAVEIETELQRQKSKK